MTTHVSSSAIPDSAAADPTGMPPSPHGQTKPRVEPPAGVPRSSVAAWCVTHRWWVLALATLGLVGSVMLLSTGIVTTPQEQSLVGESARAQTLISQADFGDRPTERIIATVRTGSLAPEQAAALGAELAGAYQGVEGVARVGDPIPGADGRSVVIPLELAAARSATDTTLPQPEEVVAPSLAVTTRLVAANSSDAEAFCWVARESWPMEAPICVMDWLCSLDVVAIS